MSVPETQQFIYNASFVRHLSVKPILCLFSPNSTETDRQAACYRSYYNTHNLVSAREKNMADGLTAALSPQSNFVVSYQLRMGNRCQRQAGSGNTQQLRGFVSVLFMFCCLAALAEEKDNIPVLFMRGLLSTHSTHISVYFLLSFPFPSQLPRQCSLHFTLYLP